MSRLSAVITLFLLSFSLISSPIPKVQVKVTRTTPKPALRASVVEGAVSPERQNMLVHRSLSESESSGMGSGHFGVWPEVLGLGGLFMFLFSGSLYCISGGSSYLKDNCFCSEAMKPIYGWGMKSGGVVMFVGLVLAIADIFV